MSEQNRPLRKFVRRTLAAASVAAVAVTTQALAQSPPEFYSPDQSAFGRKMNEWSAQWWQYVLSIPTDFNPLLDNTGKYCTVAQQGPVWFLMGSLAGSTLVTRTCNVPEGLALFFPIINIVDVNTTNQTVSELRAEIAPCMDHAINLKVTVDGADNFPGPRQRTLSIPFAVETPTGGLGTLLGLVPDKVYSPAVDDGYYVMLKPLSVGSHTISFSGQSSASCGPFSANVTYHLNIVAVTLQ
jgi:hypothetical protein